MGSFIVEDTSSRSRASDGSFPWGDDASSAGRPEGATDDQTGLAAAEKADAAAAGGDRAGDVTLLHDTPRENVHDTQRENFRAASFGLVQDARMLAKRLTLLAERRGVDHAVAPTRSFK